MSPILVTFTPGSDSNFERSTISLKENKRDGVDLNSNGLDHCVRKNEGKILRLSADCIGFLEFWRLPLEQKIKLVFCGYLYRFHGRKTFLQCIIPWICDLMLESAIKIFFHMVVFFISKLSAM